MKSEIENEKAIETIANHAAKHLKSEYMLTFLEGYSYRCRFDNSEFCDNGEELGSPGFEEWYEIDFRVIETLKEGPNKVRVSTSSSSPVSICPCW